MNTPELTDEELEPLYREELARRKWRHEAQELSLDLRAFGRQAWKVLKPVEVYKDNWHIDAITEHLQAVTTGDITRLQIWVPRATMKSLNVSVFWHPWEWTTRPWLRYWTAVYELGLSRRLAGMSRDIIQSQWYQERWGDMFTITKDAEIYLKNDKGGTRLATAPGSTALGEHGHRIIIDDPINALAADATSRAVLDATNDWYDSTVEGSKADPKATAIVIIMQRLHENDPAAHALEDNPDEWTILCLPERYETHHPFVWPDDPRGTAQTPRAERYRAGFDVERGEDALLWPLRRGKTESERLARALGTYRAAGQMQQRPSAREGDLLKRYWWRFYDPRLFTDENMKNRRPRFAMVVQSVDAPLKDKETNDLVAIQAWGAIGGDRYLLDLKKGHMSKEHARRAILEQARYVRRLCRNSSHYVLIEKAGYGPELIAELKRELTGVKALSPSREGDKVIRAESASSALETGNCFLPGYREGHDELSMPDDSRNSADVTEFINDCAGFPNVKYDDQIDAWSQAMNWLSARPMQKARVFSSFR